MRFFKAIFLFIYRAIHLVYLLVVLFLVAGIFALVSLFAENKAVMPSEAVLLINPHGVIMEQRGTGFLNPDLSSEVYVRDLKSAVSYAAKDPKVKALALVLDDFGGSSMASLHEVGYALKEFKTSGKKIYAYAIDYRLGSYFLASYADEIWLDELGEVAVDGIATQNLYFKEALDRFGITAYVSRTGPYKSAVEPYLANSMSPENRSVLSLYMNDSWQWVTQEISQNRQESRNVLINYAQNRPDLLTRYQGNGAKIASDAGLVDQIGSLDGYYDHIKTVTKLKAAPEDFLISYTDYLTVNEKNLQKEKGSAIAIVYASGTIQNGGASIGSIDGDTYAGLIKDAADNENVKAIVIRLDSGGGDAYASETIYRAITKAREKKPVLISMAGTAASGAYWLSLAAQEIWAEPTSLTGSIGVFSYFLSAHNLLSKYGVHSDGVAINSQAYALSNLTAPDQKTLSMMNEGVSFMYNNFLNRVVKAKRAGSLEEANAIGEGRIYSGIQAKKLGLVDELGGLTAVVTRAAQLTELDNYHEIIYEDSISPILQAVEKRLLSSSQIKFTGLAPVMEVITLKNRLEQFDGKMMVYEPNQLYLN